MTRSSHAGFFFVSLFCGSACASTRLWERVLLPLATPDDGASPRCLDGSPGAYYIRSGLGANSSKFVFFQQAGGWAESPADLAYRAKSSLGSTLGDPATADWSIEDWLTANATVNPLFATWSSVYSRYCDGASRASHRPAALHVNSTPLWARGFDILRGTVDALLGAAPGGGAPSLASATDLVISGGSAGGLAVFLHADYIAARVRMVNPSARVVAVANDGFFVDAPSIWAGTHIFGGIVERVVEMGNVSGAPEHVNAACWAAHAQDFRWRCFFAEVSLPYMSTPIFIMNSFQDEYQAGAVIAPDPASLDEAGGVREYPLFKNCTAAPATGCNASQYYAWRGLGSQILTRAAAARDASPARARIGAFWHSCPTHGTAINGRSVSVHLRGAPGGITASDALHAWLSGATGDHGYVDAQWPNASAWPLIPVPNADCPAPYR